MQLMIYLVACPPSETNIPGEKNACLQHLISLSIITGVYPELWPSLQVAALTFTHQCKVTAGEEGLINPTTITLDLEHDCSVILLPSILPKQAPWAAKPWRCHHYADAKAFLSGTGEGCFSKSSLSTRHGIFLWRKEDRIFPNLFAFFPLSVMKSRMLRGRPLSYSFLRSCLHCICR